MNQRLSPLTKPYFILSLVILLINDFYLKYEYHNWVTGKLSDVAGLFVFVYFWTAIFPTRKNIIYIATGLMFVYWKSIYSQPLINLFSTIFYSIDRTVDISDLLALLILPVAYIVNEKKNISLPINPIPIALLTIFSFCATSLPVPTQTFDRPEYILFRSVDFEIADKGSNEFRTYNLDSMTVVAVSSIETMKEPALRDEFYRSQILADLDLRVLCISKGNYENDSLLSSFRPLRDSLTITGLTSVTLALDSVSDELHFRGTRLDGPFRRYSKEKKLLIDGRYKHGIQDSIWSFYNGSEKIATQKHFVAGEVRMIARFQNEQLVERTDVNTRKDAVIKQFVVLTMITVLLILIAVRLILNFRASEKGSFLRRSNFEKIIQILLLPTIIFMAAKVIQSVFSESQPDIFKLPFQFMLTNILLIPILALVHYQLKLRTRFDLVLYILLFTLSLVWLDEFQYLKQI